MRAKYLPRVIFNLLISIYNSYQYKVRHSGKYKYYREYFKELESYTLKELEEIQIKRLAEFIAMAKIDSAYYEDLLTDIHVDSIDSIDSLKNIPFLDKDIIINNLSLISTIDENKGVSSYTGGTTGSSMKVIYTKEDIQERFACLDNFRERYGYRLGDKVAWFSGKDLLNRRDKKNRIYYKDDYFNRIRFYSTFDISQVTAKYYIESLEKFNCKYIVGFPSTVYEMCKIAESQGIKFNGKINYFFPTAEVVTREHRLFLKDYLGCRLVDQYASSEGAPFIFECSSGMLHIDITTGVFEVINESGEPSTSGNLVVTSFSTRGTPLIRYKIGDRLTLSNAQCNCGSKLPIASSIDGRRDDYLFSDKGEKVNLGNISNSTKKVSGILQFQIIQRDIGKIFILVVKNDKFSIKSEQEFRRELLSRFGQNTEIDFKYVEIIAKEASGKFRIIKNFVVEKTS
ncbi:phenylacetate--CoA ligase family protein [Aliivibrio finisterrensis]|uniref:Phenylacetate--CoA ligase family protein n=1 Tax=Aliivibrio finisterrensis TaxID=511998 RepID=A0A4Q5KDE8_9GAMM|nr:phenylacetate--CoA ligase family protein [Aliivibrio finisterrensis]RYU44041.1 phenylacetate--CoA ligase family protein [Aliivibrio finisterrensis]